MSSGRTPYALETRSRLTRFAIRAVRRAGTTGRTVRAGDRAVAHLRPAVRRQGSRRPARRGRRPRRGTRRSARSRRPGRAARPRPRARRSAARRGRAAGRAPRAGGRCAGPRPAPRRRRCAARRAARRRDLGVAGRRRGCSRVEVAVDRRRRHARRGRDDHPPPACRASASGVDQLAAAGAERGAAEQRERHVAAQLGGQREQVARRQSQVPEHGRSATRARPRRPSRRPGRRRPGWPCRCAAATGGRRRARAASSVAARSRDVGAVERHRRRRRCRVRDASRSPTSRSAGGRGDVVVQRRPPGRRWPAGGSRRRATAPTPRCRLIFAGRADRDLGPGWLSHRGAAPRRSGRTPRR